MKDIMQAFTFRKGRVPLLVSMPHAGTHIPAELAAGMTAAALQLPDTDWHLDRLYNFLDGLGASVLVATHSRYVIDLNRPSDNANLYPGQDTTGLCPIDTFHKQPVYRDGMLPDDAAIAQRVQRYWMPYHAQLASELERMREEHGIAMLWDAHSICSMVPRFFEGSLPDFNLGTASGASCDPLLGARLLETARQFGTYSAVLNGRFKGGHITRHYGKPEQRIHAVQLELAEATYMEECHPYRFDEALANGVRPALRAMIDVMLDVASGSGR
jgi:N-formylglutamate deformylase